VAPPKKSAGSKRGTIAKALREKLEAFGRGFAGQRENRFSRRIAEGKAALPDLAKVLEGADPEARIDALQAIGRIFEEDGPTKEAIDALLAHSGRVKEKGIGPEKHATLYALGSSRVPSLVHSFVELLGAEDPIVVNVASFVLGYARWEQAVPYLIHVATRSFEPTAEAAIWALGETRSKEAFEPLVALSTHGQHLEAVIPALARLGDPRAIEVIAPVLSSQIANLRLAAAASIWSIIAGYSADAKDRKALKKEIDFVVAPLHVASKDSFAPVAIFALLALANLGERIDEGTVRTALELGEKTSFSASEAFHLTRRLFSRGKPPTS
jgi:PBS lyase HEAT-like repeat-containing protein